jgi:AGZA family xanthine/uracil permease-like MFS transporter
MASMINQKIPGFIDDKTKGFPRQIATYSMDGIAVIIGSLFGLAPLTVYIESASGIREGGRTGLTALVTAFGFLVSLFFTPLIVSIPPYATGPALVLVSGSAVPSLPDCYLPYLPVCCTPPWLTCSTPPPARTFPLLICNHMLEVTCLINQPG